MKAYVLTQRETLCEQNRPIPQPDKGEVVIRLERCGICRTDRKAYHTGQRDLHMPRVLGHEIAGTIVSVDSTVNTYQKGMRVAVHPGIFCGTCETCMTGKDQLCEAMQILGFHLDGGFQEYCLIPAIGVKQGVILPLPDSLSFAKAVLAEPLACAINMMGPLQATEKDRLLIIGAGALGILTAKLWQSQGCSEISFIEPEEYKRKLAVQMGFTVYQDKEDFLQAKRPYPTVAIPCCPQNDGFYTAIQLLCKGGRLGFFSGLSSDSPLNNKLINELHYKELCLYGAYGCALQHTKTALQLLADKIVTNDMPITEVSFHQLEENLKDIAHKDSLISALTF